MYVEWESLMCLGHEESFWREQRRGKMDRPLSLSLSLSPKNFALQVQEEEKPYKRRRTRERVSLPSSLTPKCQVNKSKNGEAKNPQKERVNLPKEGKDGRDGLGKRAAVF